MQPKYDIETLKFSVDKGTYGRALELYNGGRVTGFSKDPDRGYYATVRGTQLYRVSVSSKNFNAGRCDCYLGQKHILCKHMVAVAITALTDNGKFRLDLVQDNQLIINPDLGEISKAELAEARRRINAAIRKIKYYNGPSSTWFEYQNSLEEGCNRLRALFGSLPVSSQTCSLIVASLIKIDKKLRDGVDDSNGTVGHFIKESVDLLAQFAQKDSGCIGCFYQLTSQQTCFEWEVPLVELINQKGCSQARRQSDLSR